MITEELVKSLVIYNIKTVLYFSLFISISITIIMKLLIGKSIKLIELLYSFLISLGLFMIIIGISIVIPGDRLIKKNLYTNINKYMLYNLTDSRQTIITTTDIVYSTKELDELYNTEDFTKLENLIIEKSKIDKGVVANVANSIIKEIRDASRTNK